MRDQFGPKALECEVPWHEEPPPDLDIPEEGDGEAPDEKAIDVASVGPSRQGPGDNGGMPPG